MPEVSIERLRQIEWAGDNCDCPCCPVCERLNPLDIPKDLWPLKKGVVYGHQKDCWLGRICYKGEAQEE